jgi:hypothetical protein
MSDYLIENLTGMCRYGCTEKVRADYCTTCEAAERLKAVTRLQTRIDHLIQRHDQHDHPEGWLPMAREIEDVLVDASERAEKENETLKHHVDVLQGSVEYFSGGYLAMKERAERAEQKVDALFKSWLVDDLKPEDWKW